MRKSINDFINKAGFVFCMAEGGLYLGLGYVLRNIDLESLGRAILDNKEFLLDQMMKLHNPPLSIKEWSENKKQSKKIMEVIKEDMYRNASFRLFMQTLGRRGK